MYVSAAHTIAHCINLWCDTKKVFKVVHLLQEEALGRSGELNEDNAASKVHKEYLSKMYITGSQHTTKQ